MDIQSWWPQFAAVLFILGIWLAVTFLLSYLSGWAFLAEHYRAALPYAGRYERIRGSQMGPLGPFGGARNALYAGVDAQGLHLRMLIIFRVNCRDLFIPSRDITVTRGKAYFADYVGFRFRAAPKIPLRIFGKAGEDIKALAGTAWPAEPPHDVVAR